MKSLIKKIHIIFILLIILLSSGKVLAKDSVIKYNSKDISNYFLGIWSINQNYNELAFKHLKKTQSLKDIHSKFNVEFIRTLILLEKFDEAVDFAKSLEKEKKFFFETYLVLGLDSYKNKDYPTADKYFKEIIKIPGYKFFFENFIGNILISWNKASQGMKKESFEHLLKISGEYNQLNKVQNVLLKCYFDSIQTEEAFVDIIENKNYNFSRYNFFLANYLLRKNKIEKAKKVIKNGRNKHNSNLLLKQTEVFLLENKKKKIENFFNCKNPNDSIAEFFYIIANLYASEKDYQLSNFYLKISLFLNNKFLSNKALLAENYYYQQQTKLSKKVYYSIKSIGRVYSWYASQSISKILLDEKDKKIAIKNLQEDFNSISNPSFEHYYDLANFYKDTEYYKKSIQNYSIALQLINKDHILVPKILDRRGTSYERIGDWEKAEKDLIESLEISPEQPHVLNYLAYTWVDKGINLDESLEMLKKATSLRENDGYIIDSLGWAYYAKKNYEKAEFFLQKAVELLPSDPIINDHYADTLWMLNKNIQARYFWNYILKLEDTEQKLIEDINKKLIFGIIKKL